MKDRAMSRWSTYDPYYIELGDKKIVDIIITHHAQDRWISRVDRGRAGLEEIGQFIWDRLKRGQIEPYYRHDEDVYIVDDDLLMVVNFAVSEQERDLIGNPLHKMMIITFLGRLSESLELRDLRSYYSWLRHSRRMTLVKNARTIK
ncbi:hypothetical protein [Paenibacillus sp. SYP-B4298]|uniref:hypothetical protein n=1 Tax=Paenibacillus sp. SYP-B4298 TaxID=2996034 RepID=UPI0022DDE272|nr:hypothetical protein [Paenibacillus sp. SYP-B4298]